MWVALPSCPGGAPGADRMLSPRRVVRRPRRACRPTPAGGRRTRRKLSQQRAGGALQKLRDANCLIFYALNPPEALSSVFVTFISVDWLNAGAALFSAGAAGGAWLAARRANRTADALAHIERSRWHVDLTPDLSIDIMRVGPGTDRLSLTIKLKGPIGLDRLDRVVLSVVDDGYTHFSGNAGAPTQEEVDAIIWGPYRFEPRIDEVVEPGRSTPSFRLDRIQWKKFSLSPTSVPVWADSGQWRSKYASDRVRLSIECHRDGFKPWFLYKEVLVEDPQVS